MKIATVLFRSALLAAAALSSACVGYPVYSEPVDAVYYPVEQPVYYPQTSYYPYPVYRSHDPSYVLWYNNNHYFDRGHYHGHYDNDRDHDRGHDRGYNGRGRDTRYDDVRRDLCRDGRCDDRGRGNDRGDRGDRNDNRKPPPVAFQPRPRDNVVAPRNPRDSGRVVKPRPQQGSERTGGNVNAKPARIIDVQNQVRVTAPPPRQDRSPPRQDNAAPRRGNDRDNSNGRDRQRRAQQ
ncbi:MAG TPA: hypothetical protein VGE51_04975 [Fontimonas sp.]